MTYKQYLNSSKWQQLRQQVFNRARKNANSNNKLGVCERCGYTPWKPCLQVHHINYNNVFNEKLEDLILICPNCHKEMHRQKAE
jgi:predicted HNH restriction endonuclease